MLKQNFTVRIFFVFLLVGSFGFISRDNNSVKDFINLLDETIAEISPDNFEDQGYKTSSQFGDYYEKNGMTFLGQHQADLYGSISENGDFNPNWVEVHTYGLPLCDNDSVEPYIFERITAKFDKSGNPISAEKYSINKTCGVDSENNGVTQEIEITPTLLQTFDGIISLWL